ncbi:TPMT family class I SAM-dependent methyltransferase [Abyssalbus ytuae]|uniref:TPMT family class I SAM-dependent methyltransferase n=1 Tax=Abyssalbus ytuae TaxID=2926907 RepID=A0A9E7A205_9FLAO|nr:TPMT family class I SAM-dependent methyltransferase [Abyssalbus ytuae]UOB18291.1 TPMT family class I SAM-dependent methyltransferase [Abyssalbus ytuae]
MTKLNKEYWEEKYKTGQTGWDIGHVSTPIKEYIDQIKNKDIKILIPGAGHSYEAEYLYEKGFKNIYVADIAAAPLNTFKKRLPKFPEEHLIQADFFDISGTFDLIIEHTFFCALNPLKRKDYALKVFDILNEKGKIAGLLFDFPLTEKGPPYGGCKEEYVEYFNPYFKINKIEACYNSIKPRKERELFFIFEKK